MVLVGAVRDYLNRMLNDIPGMKVLILDSQTVCAHTLLFLPIHLFFRKYCPSYGIRLGSIIHTADCWAQSYIQCRRKYGILDLANHSISAKENIIKNLKIVTRYIPMSLGYFKSDPGHNLVLWLRRIGASPSSSSKMVQVTEIHLSQSWKLNTRLSESYSNLLVNCSYQTWI